jgi:acetyl-CoA carboxylase, biotin carboxylase subunit
VSGGVRKLLVANRGEIAVRVFRTCRELGIATVAVAAPDDAGALHARSADETVAILDYLYSEEHIRAAKQSGADAIHPGYGFLAESPDFARAVEAAGLVWIGPPPEAMELGGDKQASKRVAREACVPVLEDGRAEELGFPLLVKAAAGGGGRGMRVVRSADELEAALEAARREAQAAFRDGTVFLERYLEPARHVEIQLLADAAGEVLALGERECSIQRRHQKLLEESPSVGVDEELRAALEDAAVRFARAIGYRGAGTAEFLVAGGELWFLELNARIQVEHPVTEEITEIDLILEQIRIAAGNDLDLQQSDIRFHGHAIECRINAENPATFRPSPGRIVHYHPPGGLGVRVDSAVYHGYTIPPFYDSLLGKLIVHGKTRAEALMRLKRALDEFVIDGIETTVPLFQDLVREKDIIDGDYHIHWLEEYLARTR